MIELSLADLPSLLLFFAAWVCLFTEAWGLISLHNIYSRMLVSALADTAAMILIFTATLLYERSFVGGTKLIVLLVFLLVMNPVTSHLIARSARRNGVGLSDRNGGER